MKNLIHFSISIFVSTFVNIYSVYILQYLGNIYHGFDILLPINHLQMTVHVLRPTVSFFCLLFHSRCDKLTGVESSQ